MPDNPLAGLQIPSLAEIVEKAVGMLGIGTLDLAHPLQRERLRKALEQNLSLELEWTLQKTVEAAAARAVSHVFKVMRDPDYQGKRRKRLAKSRQEGLQRRAEKAEAERKARMDYSKQNLEVTKRTLQ